MPPRYNAIALPAGSVYACLMRGRVTLLAGATLVCAALSAYAAPIRNVILMFGDGMGDGQIEAARCYKGAPLDFESLSWLVHVTTHSAGGAVPESSAAATSIATGVKGVSGVISCVSSTDTNELETVLEYFQKRGKSAGLVTTSYITDATPGAFAAHETNRWNYAAVGADYMAQTRPHVLMGGGLGMSTQAVLAAGYTLVTTKTELLALDPETSARVCGLFGSVGFPYVCDGYESWRPRLAQMTDVALKVLDNDPDGFFLMVEGGMIDHAGHEHRLDANLHDVLDFESAFQTVTNWCMGRTDTLLIVTGDHETGGLVVTADNGVSNYPSVMWTNNYHSYAPVPAWAWGVNASRITNCTDNTHLCGVLKSQLLTPPVCEEILPSAVSTGRIEMSWSVVSGDVYRAEILNHPATGSWESAGIVTAKTARLDIADTPPTNCYARFYRLLPIE